MGKLLGSSAERRLQAFRRELTLDLFTHHGPFWQDVRWIRSLRGIAAEPAKPPDLDPGKVHLPPDLRSNDWTRSERPLALSVIDRTGAPPPLEVWLGNWSRQPEQRQALAEWMVLLQVLHDRIVPAEQRVETPTSSSLEFWMGFLSACLLYDPPRDDLLGFADHAVAAYGSFLNPLNPWADEDDAPQMLAPPIRFLPDADAVLVARERHHRRVIDALHRRLAPRGIDVWEMVYDAEYWDGLETGDDAEAIRPRPYIVVDAHTTEEDVRNAFKLMAADMPDRPPAVKPRRDRLVCLQCAIWYDECDWSLERIAKRFGWTVQRSDYAKPRCETAQQHIAEGRRLREQRRDAA